MFLLKKMLAPFLLPPGIFIVPLLFSGIWLLFRKHLKAGSINVLIAAAIWSLSVTPVSDALLRGLESDLKIPEKPEGDVIILLGGGLYDGSPDLSGTGVPAEYMLGRIITAVRLQKMLNVPIIVSGGQVFAHKKAEAPIVKRFLEDLGVPPGMIITEEKSRDTVENARYTRVICEAKGLKKPLLVTSAFHMKRSVISFEKTGMKVVPVPAFFLTWKDRKYEWNDYLPERLEHSCIALREYMGLFFYKIAY